MFERVTVSTNLDQFLETGFNSIEGWCDPKIVRIMGALADLRDASKPSSICEIGVFQGKFFIALANAFQSKASLAIDIFDQQELNSDGSGGGTSSLLSIFKNNADLWAPVPSGVHCMPADSLALDRLKIEQIRNEFGRFAAFSIDGGHTATHVINDYKIAEELTEPDGFIVIDDILNGGWPGVIEGVATLYLMSRPKFVPIGLGCNKLILTGFTHHASALQALFENVAPSLGQTFGRVKFFGHDIAVF